MKGDDRQLRLAAPTTSCIVWVFAKPAIENNREGTYKREATILN